ncbi:uncharacterized protein LOC126576941 [Anopheles aquasalis]|uniref:uncharacterized protein LOC126576941 n=1 Tax=Anopheles aquasalis TaxID=42839 RepID=UPI00215AFF04|nr:uncharacterized protein LOC126576941 [Anopheles aquasalis]
MSSWQYGVVIALVACAVEQAIAVHGQFERVEQVSGFDYLQYDLRVRKYNRTTATLNGTIHIKQPIDDTFRFSTDVFHSSLGNQQFQHMPLHLPESGFCQFMDLLHREYPNAVKDVVHITEPEQCPIPVCSMHFLDMEFPTEVLPQPITRGLWKLILKGVHSGETMFQAVIVVRVYDDLYY